MTSIAARLMRRALRARVKPTAWGDGFVEETRRRVDGPQAPTILGRHVTRRALTEADGPVPGEWVDVQRARRHILYLHGGYYISGGSRPYRNVAARLARPLGSDVRLIDYRLAREHPYPAAVDDANAAYGALLASGTPPSTVAVVGDSAGAGPALALLLRARAEGTPLPGAVVLLSPWADLTCSGASVDRNDAADDMLSAGALRAAAACYAGSFDPADPELSPLFGDLSGLPPLFVTADDSETLLDDALRLDERARSAGTVVQLRRTTGLFHIWPIVVPYVPEARRTVAEAVDFLDSALT